MNKLFFTLSLLACTSLIFAQGSLKKQNDSAEVFIKKTISDLDISGLAVAVVSNGKIIKMSSYGKANLDWNIDVDSHTNFQIASTSKLLSTTLVMKAINDKKLSLDDPLSKYIDNIPSSWNGMKVLHLLNHTSGIKDFTSSRSASVLDMVNSLKDSTLAYPIGTKQSYVSADYCVLLYVLEKVYGKPYPEILRTEVTGPLKMNDGAFDRERTVSGWIETDVVPRKASTYYIKDGQRVAYKGQYPHYSYTAGGYFASLSDLCNWAIGLDNGILFPKQLERQLAYSPVENNPKLSGFSKIGWSIGILNKIPFGGHSGGPAFGDVSRFPEQGITIIVLTNDGEVLPYFAPSLATFYIPGYPFERKVTKFKRVKSL